MASLTSLLLLARSKKTVLAMREWSRVCISVFFLFAKHRIQTIPVSVREEFAGIQCQYKTGNDRDFLRKSESLPLCIKEVLERAAVTGQQEYDALCCSKMRD